jgi:hypothetical protein
MVIFWRGAGIMIPILLGISFWITSYWFEDTRFGNYAYMGWSILWPSILITLGGLTDLMKNEPDENGKVEPKTPNDLFWIPLIIWGPILLGISIYLIFKGPGEGYGDNKKDYSEYIEDVEEAEAEVNDVLLNFYNDYDDTTYIELFESNSTESLANADMAPKKVMYVRYEYGDYDIQVNEGFGSFTLPEPTDVDETTKYYSNWLVLGAETDLVLVNVSEACRSDINETELKEIDWSKNVVASYDGDDIIEVVLNDDNPKAVYSVYNPGYDLPLELEENEVVFTMIPFSKSKGYSESFLDSVIVDLCY